METYFFVLLRWNNKVSLNITFVHYKLALDVILLINSSKEKLKAESPQKCYQPFAKKKEQKKLQKKVCMVIKQNRFG